MENADDDAIRHALTVARRHGFVEVELENGDTSFQAKLGQANPMAVPHAAKDVASSESKDLNKGEITATLVGYYQQAEPALAVGRQVTKGQVVAVIAALGLANDIESSVSGEVTRVLVEEGQSLQYGQTIAEVRLSA